MKEIKERVTDELLPKAFSIYRDTRVWIDTVNHWLVIDAAASAKADEVIGLLVKTIDRCRWTISMSSNRPPRR